MLATSGPLLDRLRRRRPDAVLLPNAADAELFGALADPAPDPGRLTVGYAGAVDDWFDAGLLSAVARLRPAWRFEIVGALEGRSRAVSRLPENVVFLGERPYREMPAIRSRFDVEVIDRAVAVQVAALRQRRAGQQCEAERGRNIRTQCDRNWQPH